MQYTIWLIPSEPTLSHLQQVVNDLAAQYGGPAFEPHLTLINDIEDEVPEIEKKLQQLATKAKPLELTLGPVSFSTSYFQSVFVRVDSTAALMDLNLEGKKIFNQANFPYTPHISLLYGDQDMATREKVASHLQLPPLKFTVSDFIVNPSVPDTTQWHHAATVPFNFQG